MSCPASGLLAPRISPPLVTPPSTEREYYTKNPAARVRRNFGVRNFSPQRFPNTILKSNPRIIVSDLTCLDNSQTQESTKDPTRFPRSSATCDPPDCSTPLTTRIPKFQWAARKSARRTLREHCLLTCRSECQSSHYVQAGAQGHRQPRQTFRATRCHLIPVP